LLPIIIIVMTSILDWSHLTKMELVCSQGKEVDRSANSCESLKILEVAGVEVEILLLCACLKALPYLMLMYPNRRPPRSIL
jgi:hypothetical protein